jgi:hypothetical protein
MQTSSSTDRLNRQGTLFEIGSSRACRASETLGPAHPIEAIFPRIVACVGKAIDH